MTSNVMYLNAEQYAQFTKHWAAVAASWVEPQEYAKCKPHIPTLDKCCVAPPNTAVNTPVEKTADVKADMDGGERPMSTKKFITKTIVEFATKTMLCKYWQKGMCKYMTTPGVCTYAHGTMDMIVNRKNKFKFMCKNGAACTYKLSCHFAHTKDELKQNMMCPEVYCDDNECQLSHSVWQLQGKTQEMNAGNEMYRSSLCKFGKICTNHKCQYAHHQSELNV
jgi:hypothetical protein